MTGSRELKEGQQSNAKYKRLIYRKTSEKVDEEICRAL